jgi:HEAT repeat protein
LMASTDEPTRVLATDLLVQFKDARAAKPLAMLLPDAHKTYWAGNKLIEIGSSAEPAIIPYLASDDPGTRRRAADVLGRIGTTASLRALSVVAAKDKDFFSKVAATNAINAIKGRASGNKR